MKSLFFKTQTIFIFLFGFMLVFAQNGLKIPQNSVFYMEVNGKQLNQKVNWEKFNPLLKEMGKKDKKASWNDYSKTGIKYDATQYHYATMNDSVKSYNMRFALDNQNKFLEFINSIKKKGQEVTKKNNYSYIDIDNDVFVAWSENRAVLSIINYQKPYKWDDDYAVDSAVAVIDSTAVAIDSAYVEEEKPFDYKEEIQYLKDDIKYLKQSIKDNNAEILKLQKDIKYLEKHHKYPEEKKEPEVAVEDSTYAPKVEILPPPISREDYYEDESHELDSSYQKKMDSLNIEEFKIVKKFAEDSFDQYFNSNKEISVTKDMLSFRDPNSDVFIYADYGKIINDGIYKKMPSNFNFTGILGKLYNSNTSYNLYFDKDKVRLVNNYQHKDSETQKNISDVYKGKKNKKLAALINDKSIGYYVMNVDGSKYFDMMYGMLKNSGDSGYQKEAELVIETMKIVLDEEAIAKIAPGNGIFVLNELKSKNVEYTDYDYDENYNEKEVKKTKDVMVPDFTFAFATENENYWKRVFNVLTSNKAFAKNFSKSGEFYAFKDEKNKNTYVEQLFFTVKDGIVYVTTSKDNINTNNQSEISKQWMKDSSKYPLSGRLNIQKLLGGLDKEFKSKSEKGTLDILRKNAGEVYFKTESKAGSIQTEMNYNIKSNSENSLMYFFDLIEDFYKNSQTDKSSKTL
ncbi:hypothetical protein [Chryseobacterium luquanense]|uniref:DUF4836 domain-containing protein n=1 Tax=Chryseobacterium luquanense TaxID=2983766 RepID=A0ABT3Y5J0_9FLAO|nr:hypothetical protein [Chryseobacterium luquanense]MCX8533424.1 hypothetical protein [Chryseobacterium luquanense]